LLSYSYSAIIRPLRRTRKDNFKRVGERNLFVTRELGGRSPLWVRGWASWCKDRRRHEKCRWTLRMV